MSEHPEERFVWKPGDVRVHPRELEVAYVVRADDGRIIEIALNDGTRLYAPPESRKS